MDRPTKEDSRFNNTQPITSDFSAMQSQKGVAAYSSSKQKLSFVFEEHCSQPPPDITPGNIDI